MGLLAIRARRHGRGVTTSCMSAVAAAGLWGVSAAFPGAVAHAQSLGDVLSKFIGSNQTTRSSRRTARPADVVVPPIPVKQPKPWHTQTQRHPSTGPEPDWPKLLPPDSAAAKPVIAPEVPRLAAKPVPATPSPVTASASDSSSGVPSPVRRPVPSTPIIVEDVYTPDDIATAQARCKRILSRIDAEVIPEFPIKKGQCGHPAPVKLVAVGTSPRVAVTPPAIVNCDMVEALYDWLNKDLQPLARKHLGSRIVTLENMSSYSCRNVYGRVNTRLSQHAKANALDIRGFVTAKGKVARLLDDWGPTGRDIEAFQIAQRKAEEERKALAEAAAKARAVQDHRVRPGGKVPAMRSTIGDGAERDRSGGNSPVSLGLNGEASRLGGPVPVPPRNADSTRDEQLVVKVAAEAEPQPAQTPAARFLKAAHAAACARFGTTLGPEANNAHRNHFHVDLAPRKRGNFCE